MKKIYDLVLLSLCLMFFQMGCSENASAQLNVAEIKRDGEFIWPGLEYGMTVVEAEKASAIRFKRFRTAPLWGEDQYKV